MGREEEGIRQVELLPYLAGQFPSQIRWFFWRRCHLVKVTCEYSVPTSNSDMWDRWKEKHPWMGGRLSSILCFYCGEGEGRVMISVSVADVWTCSRIVDVTLFMHVKVSILILFTVREETLQCWRFGVVEIALKLLVLICSHQHVTFWNNSPFDLFQSLI